MAEYEKTIAQMIGEVPVLRGRALLSVLSHRIPVCSPHRG